MAQKFKNLEAVWVYAKDKLPNAQITSISKDGNKSSFDLTIPKVMVKTWPSGIKTNTNILYTITVVANKLIATIGDKIIGSVETDTEFQSNILKYVGLNESIMNEHSIFSVEDSDMSGFDKCINFEFYGTRKTLDSQLKKLGKPFQLDVFPSEEAELHVKSGDLSKFEGMVKALKESINETDAQDAYRKFFEDKLKNYNVSSPAELTQEDKSKFFDEIKSEWKGYEPTNESVVNEDEVVKSTGVICSNIVDAGSLSSDALRTAILQCSGDLSSIAASADGDSLKAYNTKNEEYQNLVSELKSRGLSL